MSARATPARAFLVWDNDMLEKAAINLNPWSVTPPRCTLGEVRNVKWTYTEDEPLTPYADLDAEGRAKRDKAAMKRAAVKQAETDRRLKEVLAGATNVAGDDYEYSYGSNAYSCDWRAMADAPRTGAIVKIKYEDGYGEVKEVLSRWVAKHSAWWGVLPNWRLLGWRDIEGDAGSAGIDTDNGFSPMPAAALKEYSF